MSGKSSAAPVLGGSCAHYSRWSWDIGRPAGLLSRGGGTLVGYRRVNGSWPFW